jgi:hypothetical protein
MRSLKVIFFEGIWLIFLGENDKYIALHEVFALSALSVCGENPYIVKYFTGWIENSHLYLVVKLCVCFFIHWGLDGALCSFS